MRLGLEKISEFAGNAERIAGIGRDSMRLGIACGLVLVLIVVSALGVIYSSYKSRQLFSELQRLDREAIRLEEDWGRLLLEQSTWASPARIEHLARTRLDMVVPQSEDMVLVTSTGEVEVKQ